MSDCTLQNLRRKKGKQPQKGILSSYSAIAAHQHLDPVLMPCVSCLSGNTVISGCFVLS